MRGAKQTSRAAAHVCHRMAIPDCPLVHSTIPDSNLKSNFSVTARSIFRTNGKQVIFQAKTKRKSTSRFWELHGWTPLVEGNR